MQAIETKFLGPTDSRGSRVKATCQAGSVTISWDHRHDFNKNHRNAAIALIRKMKWNEHSGYEGFVSGELKDGTIVHVLIHFSNVFFHSEVTK